MDESNTGVVVPFLVDGTEFVLIGTARCVEPGQGVTEGHISLMMFVEGPEAEGHKDKC